MLARLYLGIDTTSCHAKNNLTVLSAQSLANCALPSGVKISRIRRCSHLMPGLADVLPDVAAFKANCDADAAASVAGENGTAGINATVGGSFLRSLVAVAQRHSNE